jgi:hypothetical protein
MLFAGINGGIVEEITGYGLRATGYGLRVTGYTMISKDSAGFGVPQNHENRRFLIGVHAI